MSLEIENRVFQNISTGIKSESKVFQLSFRVCLLSFLLFAVLDIILNIRNNLFTGAILTGSLILWNILFSFINFKGKTKYVLLGIYSVVLCGISYFVIRDGTSTGSYFYLFPVAILYTINCYGINEKEKFNSVFLYSLILFAWVALFFIFSISSIRVFLFSNLFVVRLGVSVCLSALFIRYLLNVLYVKEDLAIVNNNSDILFQCNPEGYIVMDKETKEIVEYNRFISRLFELPRDVQLTGIFLSQFMMRYLATGSVNLETLMNDLPENWHGEGEFITHHKKRFTAIINSFPYSKAGKEYQIIGIRDISVLKKTETDLTYYKDKLDKSAQVKSRFLASMSHELRTPLNGVIGSANLILAEQDLPEKVRTQTNLQLYSSEHMLSIINDILDFSKIESGKMELKNQSFNLLEALHFLINSVESQFNKNKIDLVYDFDKQLAAVDIVSDVVKLRQVLFNLISNALKFTFDGHVEIKAEIKDSNPASVTVRFSVKDTGIGIKKEKQTEIFDDFVQVHDEDATRKFGGTGLGLTISEKLVNLLGGKIELDSDIGKGTCFYFTLTFNKAVTESAVVNKPAETAVYEAPVDIRGVRILIVEDNEINAAILTKFLTKWDIRIKEAGNGVQALELMKYHQFDLILMDLEMPEMNGYTAAKIIRETNTELPVIAFTATLLENMDSLIKEYGFNDYILKPFRPSDLKKKIEKYAAHRKIEYA